MLLNCTLKNSEDGKFYVFLTTIKIKIFCFVFRLILKTENTASIRLRLSKYSALQTPGLDKISSFQAHLESPEGAEIKWIFFSP